MWSPINATKKSSVCSWRITVRYSQWESTWSDNCGFWTRLRPLGMQMRHACSTDGLRLEATFPIMEAWHAQCLDRQPASSKLKCAAQVAAYQGAVQDTMPFRLDFRNCAYSPNEELWNEYCPHIRIKSLLGMRYTRMRKISRRVTSCY
jgi:hypothetical protein